MIDGKEVKPSATQAEKSIFGFVARNSKYLGCFEMDKSRFVSRLRENIRLVMSIKNMTQTEAAALIGVNQTYITQVLGEKYALPPSQKFVDRFAEITGVSKDALLNSDFAKKLLRLLAKESLPDNGLVLSSHLGTSDDLLPQILDLYLRPGSHICDPWYGTGIF